MSHVSAIKGKVPTVQKQEHLLLCTCDVVHWTLTPVVRSHYSVALF